MFGLFNRAPVNIILRGIKSGALVVRTIPTSQNDGFTSHTFTITRAMPDGDVVITIRRDVEDYCYYDGPRIIFTQPEWMTFREARKIFNTCIVHYNAQGNAIAKARVDRARAALTEQLTREIPNV